MVMAAGGTIVAINDGSLLRSTDQGKSWEWRSADEGGGLPWKGQGLLSTTPNGTVEVYSNFGGFFGDTHDSRSNSHPAGLQGYKSVSTNAGLSWSAPRQVFQLKFDPSWCEGYPGFVSNSSSEACTSILSDWAPYSPSFTTILRTKNGTLLLMGPALSNYTSAVMNRRNRGYGTTSMGKPAPLLAYNIAIRSTDGGESFSAPIDIDGTEGGVDPSAGMNAKEASEISSAELSNGDVMILVRPNISPFMWESRSSSNGAAWGPLTRGAFPMYACFNSMLTTRSGVTMICGRYPAISCQLSWDYGMTWRFYTVDLSSAWAQGSLLELEEDDTVLWFYGSRGPGAGTGPYELRTQMLKISHDPPGLSVVKQVV
jgi:hypothetical protein